MARTARSGPVCSDRVTIMMYDGFLLAHSGAPGSARQRANSVIPVGVAHRGT